MSSIRSASSRTRISTWPRLATFWPTRSSRRPGRRDEDLDAAAQGLDLRIHRDAAVDHGRAQRHGPAVRPDALVDLHRELAGRDEDERRGPGGGPARTTCSRAGRSRSRMGSVKAAVLPVPVWAAARTSRPCEDEGDGCCLDRRRGRVALLGDGPQQIGREAERIEGQAWAPARIPAIAWAGSRERDGGRTAVGPQVAVRPSAARSIAEIDSIGAMPPRRRPPSSCSPRRRRPRRPRLRAARAPRPRARRAPGLRPGGRRGPRRRPGPGVKTLIVRLDGAARRGRRRRSIASWT